MAASDVDHSQEVAPTWKQYGAGAHDFLADGPNRRPARRIVLLAAGDLSPCLDAAGNDRPLTSLPDQYCHDGHTQSCTSSGAIIAYW